MTKDTLIEFPCQFPIKVIGLNSPSFLKEIKSITLTHFPNINDENFLHTVSKNSNYLAITLTVWAENQAMLDAFYQEITQHPDVKMAL